MSLRLGLRNARTARVCLLLVALFSALGCHQPGPTGEGEELLENPVEYRRVVSLIPSATELLYELGLGDRLIAVTTNDTYPQDVESLPKVGDQTIDFELLLELQPDLVLLDSAFNREGPRLKDLGIEVLELRSDRLKDISVNLRLLGRVFARTEEAERAVARFQNELESLPTLAARPTVFLEVWSSPLMTAGGETYLDDLLKHIGAENIYRDTPGYFTVEPESFIERLPQVIILTQSDPSQDSQARRLAQKAQHPTCLIDSVPSELTRPSTRSVAALRLLSEKIENALQNPPGKTSP